MFGINRLVLIHKVNFGWLLFVVHCMCEVNEMHLTR